MTISISNEIIQKLKTAIFTKISNSITTHNSDSAAHSSLFSNKIDSTDIINNLTTSTSGKVLDASQGKILKDSVDDKVDKVSGKGLSTEDYTSAEKTKLGTIEANANNYSHPATHASTIITESVALSNIGSSANATQHAINEAINSKLTSITLNVEYSDDTTGTFSLLGEEVTS